MIAATAGDLDDAAPDGAPDEDAEPVVVTAADMDEALRELQDTRNAMTRVLLGGADAD